IIPNGVDTEKYCTEALEQYPIIGDNEPTTIGNHRLVNNQLRNELRIPRAAPLVGIVALLRPEKNHELFLRVAARVRRDVPESQFLIVGDGPHRGELEQLAIELGLTDCVHFLGRRSDISQLLRILDVFVLTSHNEANPVSILEALSSGVPVVSTAVGSIPETVIDAVTGYLVEPGDELTMARRIAQLLQDPAQAHTLGTVGRKTVVENWSIQPMVNGYEELIEQLYRQKTGCLIPAATIEIDSPEEDFVGGNAR
ncbi:MAG TPA: glycosyltransferase, partial [Pirellulales bacterium]